MKLSQLLTRFFILVAMGITLAACNSTLNEVANETDKTALANADMIAYCKVNSCREHINIVVNTPDGEARLEAETYWPVVRDLEVHVLAGERLFIEAQFNGEGQISALRHVSENRHPDRTFEINFQQTTGNYGMHYTVRNPFIYPVHFDVALTDINGNTNRYGSCPVRGKRSFLDRTPQPALKLTLSNPRVLPPHAAIVCVG